ncbi:amino acid permease [Saccharopolyspora oryzae]|uniref:Amino acid permease n=1 Tax=Saccharopolyspora oryzae TaxID=2997343 RepID=A0ABT4VAT1_9PSEU|nr:amino acid permease [Saccharopolyspora oryzae]MDA3631080.1 amino acid permease [Saccharopolyspora oryzae]
MASSPPGTSGLKSGLGNRQMTMIAIGGVIGAGLFVGSGKAISTAGPGVLLAYIGVGALVVLIMRMLAEMAVAHPETGSFSSYANRELGPWAGLSVGWLYAYQWCVTIGFEAVAGAAIVNRLLPAIPSWLAALVFMAALIAINLVQVSSFGEFEFWFALIKVTAIVAFIALGAAALLGLVPGFDSPGLANLTAHGGFLPEGGTAVLLAALAVFFSFFGTEVVTVAAGEAVDPVHAVRRGMNSVVWRILVFYIGSIFVVLALLPWNSAQVSESPYVAVLQRLGIPGAPVIMDVIVLSAVLSCLNSGIYSSSRMLYALAERGEAPALFTKVTRTGVPAWSVLAASSIGLVTVVANYFLPTEAVFNFLLDSSGAIAVVVYLCIAVTQFRGRRRLERQNPGALTIKMWAFPHLTIAVVIGLLAVIAGMAFNADSRHSLLLTLAVTAVAVAAGVVHQNRTRARTTERSTSTSEEKL